MSDIDFLQDLELLKELELLSQIEGVRHATDKIYAESLDLRYSDSSYL